MKEDSQRQTQKQSHVLQLCCAMHIYLLAQQLNKNTPQSTQI